MRLVLTSELFVLNFIIKALLTSVSVITKPVFEATLKGMLRLAYERRKFDTLPNNAVS